MFEIFKFCKSKGFYHDEEEPLRMIKDMPNNGYVLVDVNCDVEDECHISVGANNGRMTQHTLFRGDITNVEFAEALFENLKFEKFCW